MKTRPCSLSLFRRTKGTFDKPNDRRGKHKKEDRLNRINLNLKQYLHSVGPHGSKLYASRCDGGLCRECNAPATSYVTTSDRDAYVCTECGRVDPDIFITGDLPQHEIRSLVPCSDPITALILQGKCSSRFTKTPIHDLTGTSYNGKNYVSERLKQAQNLEPAIVPEHMEEIEEQFCRLAYCEETISPDLKQWKKEEVVGLLRSMGKRFNDLYTENWVQILVRLCREFKDYRIKTVGPLLHQDYAALMQCMYERFYETFCKHFRAVNQPGKKNVPKLDLVFLYFLHCIDGEKAVRLYGKYFTNQTIKTQSNAIAKTFQRVIEICNKTRQLDQESYSFSSETQSKPATLAPLKLVVEKIWLLPRTPFETRRFWQTYNFPKQSSDLTPETLKLLKNLVTCYGESS